MFNIFKKRPTREKLVTILYGGLKVAIGEYENLVSSAQLTDDEQVRMEITIYLLPAVILDYCVNSLNDGRLKEESIFESVVYEKNFPKKGKYIRWDKYILSPDELKSVLDIYIEKYVAILPYKYSMADEIDADAFIVCLAGWRKSVYKYTADYRFNRSVGGDAERRKLLHTMFIDQAMTIAGLVLEAGTSERQSEKPRYMQFIKNMSIIVGKVHIFIEQSLRS